MKTNHPLLTMHETEEMLRLSRPTVLRMIWAQDLRAVRVGRQWRIYRESVEQMLDPHSTDSSKMKIREDT